MTTTIDPPREDERTDEKLAVPKEPWSRRFGRAVSHGPVNLLLLLIALLWLLPVFGLLAASLRNEVANTQSGWWTIFDRLSSVTFENYRSILDNDLIVHSFWNTVLITLPATFAIAFARAMSIGLSSSWSASSVANRWFRRSSILFFMAWRTRFFCR